jgi:hypothetical protein
MLVMDEAIEEAVYIKRKLAVPMVEATYFSSAVKIMNYCYRGRPLVLA